MSSDLEDYRISTTPMYRLPNKSCKVASDILDIGCAISLILSHVLHIVGLIPAYI